MHPALVTPSRPRGGAAGQYLRSVFSLSEDPLWDAAEKPRRRVGVASAWLALCGLALASVLAYSLLSAYNEPATCSMSYSRPVYHEIPVESAHSLQPARYRTYLYRQGGLSRLYTGPESLGNTPVLFIPGNAGSYTQGRSFGALAAELPLDLAAELDSDLSKGAKIDYDFFMVDFDEDLSALHGPSLIDEARYTNDAVAHILSLYTSSQRLSVPPSSVILIAHSMGGIVARTMVMLDNYVADSVNTILTLSTPHVVPPLTFDSTLAAHYNNMNSFWRRSYFDQNQVSEKGSGPDPLAKMFIISVSGGHTDLMVPPDYTLMDSLAPQSHALSLFSYNIPGVLQGIDHLAIVWCAELRHILMRSLIMVSDPSDKHRTLPIDERQQVFKDYLCPEIDTLAPGKKLQQHYGIGSVKLAESLAAVATAPADELAGSLNNLSILATNSSSYIKDHVHIINAGMLQLTLFGADVPIRNEFLEVVVPSIQSSLLILHVTVTGGTAETEIAMSHSITGRESRWYRGRSALMMWYSRGPFVPSQRTESLVLKVLASGPGSTAANLTAHVQIDIKATLASIALRYRTAAATWTFACMALCVLVQMQFGWSGRSLSFHHAVDHFVLHWLGKLLVAVALLHILLCSRAIGQLWQLLSMAPISYLPKGYQKNDLLAGLSDWRLWWVPVLVLTISSAVCILVERILSLVNLSCQQLIRAFQPPSSPKLSRQPKSLAYIAAQVRTQRLSLRQVLTSLILIVVLCYIPYQVSSVFVAAYIMIRADQESWTFGLVNLLCWTWLVNGPVVAVWAKNFTNLEWSIAFASPLNIAGVAPFILLAYVIRKNPSLPRLSKYPQYITTIILCYTALYCILHGVLHSYATHRLAGMLCLWFSLLQVMAPGPPHKPE